MRNRGIQAAAWAVLLGALLTCAVIAAGVPWVANGYAQAATIQEDALVERRDGSVTLVRGDRSVVLDASGLQAAYAPEGTSITTLADGRALVRLFDESTVNMEPGTHLRVASTRRARFSWGDAVPRVVLEVRPEGDNQARLTMGTTWLGTQLEVRAGDATVTLEPESHARLLVDGDRAFVHALSGRVGVTSAGKRVSLAADKVTEVVRGAAPLAPAPALANLIADGNFRRPLRIAWAVRSEGEPLGTARTAVDDGRTILQMERADSQGRPGDIVLDQSLSSHDLSGASYLGLTVTLRIAGQSLAGGGERDIEYPLMTKLVLERQDGSEDSPWEVGFYADDPGTEEPPSGELGVTGIPVPRGEWVTFGTGNLLDPSSTPVLLGPDGQVLTNPAVEAAFEAVERFEALPRRLLRFEMKGSGHDWSTQVDHLGLWTK
jgi:hypothetical protein